MEKRGDFLIIEFIGIPGSGKSYIAKKLNNYLNKLLPEHNVLSYHDIYNEIKRDGKKNILKVLNLMKNKSFNMMLISILNRKSSINSRKNMVKRFVFRILVYQKIKEIMDKKSDTVLVLDEGFLHFSIAYFRQNAEKPNNEKLSFYLCELDKIIGYLSIPKVFIFVDNNVKESFNRIEKREQGWPGFIGELDEDKKNRYLEGNYECYLELRNSVSIQTKKLFIDNTSFREDYPYAFSELIEYIKDTSCKEHTQGNML